MNLIEDFAKILFGWFLGFGSSYATRKIQAAKEKKSLVAALASEIEDCQRIVVSYPSADYRDATPDFKETRFAIFDTYAFRISDLKPEHAAVIREYYYAAKDYVGRLRAYHSLQLQSRSGTLSHGNVDHFRQEIANLRDSS